ncbi:MAG: putative 2-aminoethylphosphonate ABC transporter ATP-binding protein [Azospirillum sp.]|nr:putative 2-aminoethylphosphonate ABC transporter ATP-binding protein [Azospirillum sp.]MCA3264581.1 putative 2-aminoethylphosphonate ABC transporter ATP-binding protein [Azospirillum sp.]
MVAHLKIENLTKRFGGFTAVREASFEVAQGEFVCLLGPSGCGKTTLLRMIAGLETASAGRILQNGAEMTHLPPSKRDFGIVFQSYALFPNLTVSDNVAYGLRSKGVARADMAKRVDELLTLVGLPGEARKYPAQLSGGQQQRVALARALAIQPGLLLLDEPLSALDARVRQHLRHEIRALQRRLGVTTIMVTHDQEEGLTMADRIAVMNAGAIEQFAAPAELYARPATPFVADFVGTTNFLPATFVAPGRVAAAGRELAADTPAGLAPGAKLRICVRPEDVAVRDVGPGAPNRLETKVGELVFMGAFSRARLDAGGGVALQADFSANLLRDRAIAEGVSLAVALPPERLRVFAD